MARAAEDPIAGPTSGVERRAETHEEFGGAWTTFGPSRRVIWTAAIAWLRASFTVGGAREAISRSRCRTGTS